MAAGLVADGLATGAVAVVAGAGVDQVAGVGALGTDAEVDRVAGADRLAAGEAQVAGQCFRCGPQPALLERAIARAKDFGTDKVRIFSFMRVDKPPTVFDRVARELSKAAETAKRENIRLVLENENSCNVATGAEAAAMLHAVKSPALGLNWDPGNAYAAGETRPYPDGYARLDKKRIWHMHLKDAQPDPKGGESTWRPIGGGKIDYLGQFRALVRDGYTGTMSLETHYSNPQHDRKTSSDESMRGLLDVIHRA